MISALIPAKNNEHQLVHTLSALVSASAEGILREVVIADENSTDGTQIVADACGANFVTSTGPGISTLIAGLEQTTRSDWILVIEPGALLQSGWQNDATAFIERAGPAKSASNLVGMYPSYTQEFGATAQLKQKFENLRHKLIKTSCAHLPMLIQKMHLQSCLRATSNQSRHDQLKQVLRASRIHWLNATVVFQK
ncbi:Glycosyl transferase family 2 [Pseudovibrio axinellae]|uniref:Glycosyl transferase family 2 n=1 Tax=Pseudovibrio axinellae TaxID=989403 RepID=A0A165YFQ7_9HYPH|nr:glycosyltransferase [Pseudovibrio axinellae]KZL18805.1 Glycosyl transferase family 2 [Pseudovibrio axinellae]SEP92195.1 Glycosyl transferase family 2 [Pseudovibrio axinellae]